MNSDVLTRLTRMPENWAASLFQPMATIERPTGVECNTTPNITANTMKIRAEYDSKPNVCGTGFTPMSVYRDGKLVMIDGPRMISAIPA